MEDAVDDQKVIDHINALTHEERDLIERESKGTATDADKARIKRIEVALDQCWDLLRQRRALREYGRNPEEAKTRDEKTVEGYSG
jgi:hypothetical protein